MLTNYSFRIVNAGTKPSNHKTLDYKFRTAVNKQENYCHWPEETDAKHFLLLKNIRNLNEEPVVRYVLIPQNYHMSTRIRTFF